MPVPGQSDPEVGQGLVTRSDRIDLLENFFVAQHIYDTSGLWPGAGCVSKYYIMKTPKLKYYYHAMSAEEYHVFEHTRLIQVSDQVQYDIDSMTTTGRTHVIFTGAAVSSDQEYRDRQRTWAPVWVLRIPADCVDRALLQPVPGSILVYRYPASVLVEHCGVERIEVDTAQPSQSLQVLTVTQ